MKKTNDEQQKAINAIINECCGITKDTHVAIISDSGKFSKKLAKLFLSSVSARTKTIKTATQGIKKPYEKTEQSVVDTIQTNPDIVISLMSNSIGEIKSSIGKRLKNYLYDNKKIFLSITSLDFYFGQEKAFFEAISINHNTMHKQCLKIAKKLTNANTVRVTTTAGTNISLDISERNGFISSGLIKTMVAGTNLPGGEAYIAPVEGKVNGKIVIDTTINYLSGRKKVTEPIIFNVKDGYVVDISGKSDAQLLIKELKKTSKATDNSIYCIAELGIGLNPKARIIGNTLIDEKVLGTCHFALGNNISFGGQNNAPIHADMVVNKPRIFLDGKILEY